MDREGTVVWPIFWIVCLTDAELFRNIITITIINSIMPCAFEYLHTVVRHIIIHVYAVCVCHRSCGQCIHFVYDKSRKRATTKGGINVYSVSANGVMGLLVIICINVFWFLFMTVNKRDLGHEYLWLYISNIWVKNGILVEYEAM